MVRKATTSMFTSSSCVPESLYASLVAQNRKGLPPGRLMPRTTWRSAWYLRWAARKGSWENPPRVEAVVVS